MKVKSPTRVRAAFSLVEVLCAILILAVALAGLSQGVAVALQSNQESERQATAALIAAGRIETLRAEGDLADGETEGDCGEGFSRYHWRQSLKPAGLDGLHEVSVVVEHTRTKQQIYELRTLLFEAPTESTLETPGRRSDDDLRRRRRNQ